MEERINKLSVLATLIVISALAVITATKAQQTGLVTAKSSLPSGNWSLRFLPYFASDYASRPVMVGSLQVNKEGFRVERIGLLNRTSKTVAAVKLGWYVSDNKDRKKVLRQGNTNLIAIPNGLNPSDYKGVECQVAFADIYKFFLKDGSLDNDFRVEIGVDSITFTDGSTWNTPTPSEVKMKSISYHRNDDYKLLSLSPAPQDCMGAQCLWLEFGGWSCEASPEGGMYCPTNCAPTQCCPTLCGYPPVCNCW